MAYFVKLGISLCFVHGTKNIFNFWNPSYYILQHFFSSLYIIF